MKRRQAELLRCPVSGGRLELHVVEKTAALAGSGGGIVSAPNGEEPIREGFLSCADSGMVYPILAGVPRMIRNAFSEYKEFYYRHQSHLEALSGQEELARRIGQLDPRRFDRRSQESFSLQWEKYHYEEKTWFKDDDNQRREEFLYNMQIAADELPGKLLLDAGCGNGHLTAAMASYHAEVVGLDLSRSVERAAAKFPDVLFVQGNVLEPPFAADSFDHLHTSGVLHHTPDPRGAFDRLVPLVRQGGRFYVQLYRRRRDIVGRVNKLLRMGTTHLPVRLLWWLCNLAAPIHSALVERIARARGEASPIGGASQREKAVSLFDNYSPRYQFRFDPAEVQRWFVEAGLRDIKDVTLANEARHMLAFVGTR